MTIASFFGSVLGWLVKSWWPKFLFTAWFFSAPLPFVFLGVGSFLISGAVFERFKLSADWTTFLRSFKPGWLGGDWNNRQLYYGLGFTAAAFIVDLLRSGMRAQLEASKVVTKGIKMIKGILVMFCVPSMGPVRGMAFARAVCEGATNLVEAAEEVEKGILESGGSTGAEKEMEKALNPPVDEKKPDKVVVTATPGEKITDEPPIAFVSGGTLMEDLTMMSNNPMDWAKGVGQVHVINMPEVPKDTLTLMKKFALSDDDMSELECSQAIAGWHNWFVIMKQKQFFKDDMHCVFPQFIERTGYGVRQYFTFGQAKRWWIDVGVWSKSEPKVISHRPTMLVVSEEEMVNDMGSQPVKTIWSRMRRQFHDICLTFNANHLRQQVAIFFLVVATTFLGVVVYRLKRSQKEKELREANKETIKKNEKIIKELNKVQEGAEDMKVCTFDQADEMIAHIEKLKKQVAELESEQKLQREQRAKARGDDLDVNRQKNLAAAAARMSDDIDDRVVASAAAANSAAPKRDLTSQNKDNIAYNKAVQEKVAKSKAKTAAKKQGRNLANRINSAMKEFEEFMVEHPAANAVNALKNIFEKHQIDPKYVPKDEKEAKQVDFYKVFLTKIGKQERICRTCLYGKTEHVTATERPDWHKEKYPRSKWISSPCLSHAEIVRLLKMNEASLKGLDEYQTVLAIHLNWDSKPAAVMKVIASPEAKNVNVHNVEDAKEASRSAFYIRLFGKVEGNALPHPAGCNGVFCAGLHIIPLHFYQVLTSSPVQTTKIEVFHIVNGDPVKTEVTDEKLLLEFDRIYTAQLTNEQLSVADQMVIPMDWWRKVKLPDLKSTRFFTSQPIVKQGCVSPCFREKDGSVRLDWLNIATSRRKMDATTPDGKFLAESLCYLADTQPGDCGFGVYVQKTLVCAHREGNTAPGEQAGRIFTPQLIAVLTNANNLNLLFQAGGSSRKD